jgi:hypothetical protein
LALFKGAALVGVDYRQFAAVFENERARAELDELLDWVAPVGLHFRRFQGGVEGGPHTHQSSRPLS